MTGSTYRVEARTNSESKDWTPLDAWFDARSRERKQREVNDLNARLGWTKYRIRPV